MVPVMGIGGMMFVVPLGGMWQDRRRPRDDLRATCAHCEGRLQMRSSDVLASGKCPHCRMPVLSDQQPTKVWSHDDDLL